MIHDFNKSYRNTKHPPEDHESNEELARQFKKFKGSPKFNLNSEEVYCTCRKPDVDGSLMVGCDGCDEWFHFKCVGIPELYKDLIARFFCKFCVWQGKGLTQYKRKCRVDTCWQPLDVDKKSKYCSNECATVFFASLVNSEQKGSIKKILDTYTLPELKALGQEFPELEQVKNYENNLDKFPPELQSELKGMNSQQDEINGKIQQFQNKCNLLVKYKEFIKSVNDQATRASTKKKVELCLYNKHLSEVDDEVVTRAFDGINNIVSGVNEGEDYIDEICIHEKRKCPRHNGWLNLINDEFIRTVNRLNDELLHLKSVKAQSLRDYSISVYEK